MGRGHTIAHNAIMHLYTHTISEITSKNIPHKSQNSANGASTPQFNHQALQNIPPTVHYASIPIESCIKEIWLDASLSLHFPSVCCGVGSPKVKLRAGSDCHSDDNSIFAFATDDQTRQNWP